MKKMIILCIAFTFFTAYSKQTPPNIPATIIEIPQKNLTYLSKYPKNPATKGSFGLFENAEISLATHNSDSISVNLIFNKNNKPAQILLETLSSEGNYSEESIQVSSVFLCDLNNDGKNELVIIPSFSQRLYYQNGSGGFAGFYELREIWVYQQISESKIQKQKIEPKFDFRISGSMDKPEEKENTTAHEKYILQFNKKNLISYLKSEY